MNLARQLDNVRGHKPEFKRGILDRVWVDLTERERQGVTRSETRGARIDTFVGMAFSQVPAG
jgi:hypothetical protein